MTAQDIQANFKTIEDMLGKMAPPDEQQAVVSLCNVLEGFFINIQRIADASEQIAHSRS